MTESTLYDVIIIGAGPAGLAAGLYTSRDGYNTLLLEKNGLPGGQIMLTEHIENYPGYEKIGGFELVEKMKQQVLNFGAEIKANKAVTNIAKQEDGNLEVTCGAETFFAKSIVLTPGSDYRQLGLPGETEMRQAGKVSYCATCDGAFYRDKEVITIGGGNTAVEDTLYLATRFTKKTTILHRRNEFRAQQVLVDEMKEKSAEHNIEIKTPYSPIEIVPTEDKSEIDHVKVKNNETGEIEELKTDGVFVFVGMVPNTGWLKDIVKLDQSGYIEADPITMRTSTPGIFVAGDCRKDAPMQLATATADGVTAAMQLKEYFRDPSHWTEHEDHQKEGY